MGYLMRWHETQKLNMVTFSKNPKQNPISIQPWNPDPMAAVRYHKLPFFARNITPGDGNCFYHAISDQILNNRNHIILLLKLTL